MPKDDFMPTLPDPNQPCLKPNPLRPITRTISLFCIWSTLISALRSQHGLLAGQPAMLGIVVTDARADLELYRECCERLCRRLIEALPHSDARTEFFAYVSDELGTHRTNRSKISDVWLLSGNRWVFCIANSEDAITEDFRLVSDAVLQVRPVTATDIQAAARVVVGIDLADEEAEMAASLPLIKLDAALRPGRSLSTVRQILKALTEQQASPARVSASSLTLDRLPGMGEATAWGLCLAKELASWRRGELRWGDLDRGIVLSGPSGTGKTTYAKALAGSCGVPLIASSLAKWQACGHLGDTLKAMRKSFVDAMKSTPSILFIDEIDSLGDRSQFTGENGHYSYQVVTGLLEALDGVEEREGVVVVGACNHPHHLDEALLRPGRLDRHVRIPMPDHAARMAILRFHGAVFPDADLAAVADRTEGRSGAFLEQLVRGGKRRARNARRSLAVEDLVAGLPELVPIPKDMQWKVAIHEAGHAVVASILGAGIVKQIVISREAEHDGERMSFRGGETTVTPLPMRLRTRDDHLDEIAVRLGGLAAEEIVFGDATDGSGSVNGSDLDNATRLAEALIGSMGMGGSLVFHGEPGSASLDQAVRWSTSMQKEVDTALKEARSRARSIVSSRRAAVLSLASEVMEAGSVDGAKVTEVIDQNG